MPVKKKTRAKTPEPTLRHVWLAGLGLASVARREAVTAAGDAAARVDMLRRQAGKLASDTQANVLHGLATAREQGEARVGQFSAEVEARLAPVLVKLGLKQAAGTPASKRPARKKPARTAANPRARKAAKKASTPRATPARKPAAKRTVRRG